MAVKLKDIQTLIHDTLEAVELFSAETISIDLGFQQQEQEEALANRGFCLVVSPVVAGGSAKDAQGNPLSATATAAILTSKIIVSVRTNPKRINVPVVANKDPGGANINVFDAVSAVVHSILAWSNTANPTEKRFEIDGDDAVTLAKDDPGCLTYDIRFRKIISV